MKIKLISGDTYTVSRAEVTNGRLEIDFNDRTAEEIQNIFTSPANLVKIELLTDDGDKFGELPGWTVYGGVTLYLDVVTAILTKEINVTQERLINAESLALSASTKAEAAKVLSEDAASNITDLQMVVCELYEKMEV